MVQIQQRILRAALLAIIALPLAAEARRFYHDDPIQSVPAPMNVAKVERRKLSEYYDYFYNTFGEPGERHTPGKKIPAQAVNTLGEVPDSDWYVNRHGRLGKRMTIQQLVAGPGNNNPPDSRGQWKVVAAKSEGITPGLTIQDGAGRRYLLKVDPMTNPEMATAADVIGSKAFYALGYYAPENYIVTFSRSQLVIDPKATFIDSRGKERNMNERDIDLVLESVPRTKEGQYRALASLFLKGQPVGPFRYHGTRSDDPNDIVPHEHRRDLRGLYVFASWLNHTDTKSINSLDTFVEENGRKFIRHHLLDFGAILGSDSFTAKSPRNGNVYLFDWADSAKSFFTFGLHLPRWARADYPDLPSVGRLEYETFQPDEWHSNYENPAFVNCLPDDGFWAAKQVMEFTDEDIRALVETGQYSNPEATQWVTKCLIERRNKIGRTWFGKVLPLDNFAVRGGKLVFEDLAARHKISAPRQYSVNWNRFDNQTGQMTPLSGQSTFDVPTGGGEYLAAQIRAEDQKKAVIAYLRRQGAAWNIVGLDRTW